MSGVGFSQVNFDVQVLEDEEEKELEKEDLERERELHELLSKELPEDLLEDDNLSFSSQGFGSSTHGNRTPEFNLDQSFEQHNGEDARQLGERKEPMYYTEGYPLLTRRGEEFIQRSGFPSNGGDNQSTGMVPPDSVPRSYDFGARDYRYNGELTNRGRLDEENGDEYLDQGTVIHGDQDYLGSHSYRSDGSITRGDQVGPAAGSSNSSGYYINGDYTQKVADGGYSLMDTIGGQTSDLELHPDGTESRAVYPIHDQNFNEVYSPHGGVPRLPQGAYDMGNNNDMNDNFKVLYTRGRLLDDKNGGTNVIEHEGAGEARVMPPPGSELAQLQVLHQARGRKLEELTKEMELKENDYEKQIRILNHQLALMKGERDGMASSLKHAQEVAADRKNDIDKLERKLHDADIYKEKMNSEKDETEAELEAARKTIETLHQQLMELEKSESLSRAREQHESVVMATRKRYEEEVVRLKQKLDDVNNSLLWKNEESKRLHDELSQARKEADRIRLDRAETVNRLTKSLELSQKQNEELLKAGSAQEISQLQSHLQRTLREKEDLERHYKTMEADLVDLREQLRIYESVSKLGFSANNEMISPLPTSDDVKRNLEADEWRTPGQGMNQRNLSHEETLSGLQKELKHCLARNRSKREEVQQLRAQLDVMKRDLANKENERQRLEIIVRKQEGKVSELENKISDLEELTRTPGKRDEYLESELRKLKTMVEEYRPKLDHYAKREKELEQLNLQLKSQMSEMVLEHDADKQRSIEQCRQSCLQFHDESMNTMKEQLKQQHEEELAKLRHELDNMLSELDQAKESYVILSEETRWIEKQTRERCDEETKRKIEELKVELDQAKSCEFEELRQKIVSEMERNLTKEKLAWQKNEEELMKGKIETEIALAKMDWAKEQEKLREEAVESALSMAEKEWIAKYGKPNKTEPWDQKMNDMKREWEKEKEFEKRVEEVGNEIRNKLEKEHEARLNTAREEWRRLKEVEIEQEVERAKSKWDLDREKLFTEAKVTSVTLAKADWSREHAESRQAEVAKAVEQVRVETLATARKDWEREKNDMEVRFENTLQSEKLKWRTASDEEKSRALETALLMAEQKWRSDHQDKVSEAVKKALEIAKETWSKERETAIESAVSQSLHSAKEAWNKNKIEEIEQILSHARKQWFTEFDIFKQESGPCHNEKTASPSNRNSVGEGFTEETNKAFSYLEAQYSKNLKEFRETELKRTLEEHERQKCAAEKELKTKYETKLKQQEERHRRKVEDMTKNSREDWDEELKQLETAYEKKFQGIIDEVEERWSQEKSAIEKEWVEKYEREREEMEEEYRVKFQKEREEIGQEMQEKYQKGIEQAREKLESQFEERLQSAVESAKHNWEEEQEEDRMALEEQYLKKLESDQEKLRKEMEKGTEVKLSQARNDALLATRKLEELMNSEKTRYTRDIENLQRELRDLKQLDYKPKDNGVGLDRRKQRRNVDERSKGLQTEAVDDQDWISLAELSDEESNCSKLHKLRKQYLITTAQLKEDLMQHAIETRKNAAKAIRTEVMKERHATAKQLRKYYLECLRQILDEDKEAFKNNQTPKSNEEKMRIMDKKLRLSSEVNESIKSQDSTLTNVTALPDGATEQYPITVLNNNSKVISDTLHSNTNPGKERHNINQDRRALRNGLSRDTNKFLSKPPRTSTAEDNKPSEVQRTGDGHEQHSDEWVNFTRGNKHGEAIDPGLSHPMLLRGKNSNTEVNGNDFRGLLVSSTDSLLSIDVGRHIDLPPAINFSQQQMPPHLLQPDYCDSSDTSSSAEDTSGISQNSIKTGEKSRGRNKPERQRYAEENKSEKSVRVQLYVPGERTHKPSKTRITRESSSRSKPSLEKATAGKFSHPVIATKSRKEQATKMTSSLPKPIRNVLPSKPLSPVSRVAPKFSYTMHSQPGVRKPDNE